MKIIKNPLFDISFRRGPIRNAHRQTLRNNYDNLFYEMCEKKHRNRSV